MGKGFDRDSRPRIRRTESGQRTKLTDARAEEIFDLLRKGVYISTAAHAVGVHPQTIHAWMAAGSRLEDEERDDYNDDEEMLVWFAWEARRAMAEAQIHDWDTLKNLSAPGMPGAVSAIQWRLERRYPEQFAKRQVVVDSDQELRQEVDLSKLDDDQLAQLERILEAAQSDEKTDKP